jgi:hypothetical protein
MPTASLGARARHRAPVDAVERWRARRSKAHAALGAINPFD